MTDERAMKYLWAPWRMDYILQKKEKGCIFCKRLRPEETFRDLVLYRSRHAFVMMNRYPYNNGHLMVAPSRHCPDLEGLREAELHDLFRLLTLSTRVLKKSLRPHGFNVGLNLGKVGGAGVEDHVHIHVVPRWKGDTNFMPVLGGTKVIPEFLEETFVRLRSEFLQLGTDRQTQKGGRRR